MDNIFLWLSGTAFAGAYNIIMNLFNFHRNRFKYLYDGYANSRIEANIRHVDDVPDTMPRYSKINGTIVGCAPLMHMGADNTLEQYDNTIYLETRIQQLAEERCGEVKELKPNESIYLSIAPTFSLRLMNNAKCTVYTNGVNPYFLSVMSHPVKSTPIITEKQEMIGTPIHPPVPTTIVKAGSESVYGVGAGENVTIYGDLTRYENGFCIQKSPYKFCISILLDCGWDDNFDANLLEPLREIVPNIQLVLISHPDLEHLGALPYIHKHFNLTARIYCTQPICSLGRICLKDIVKTRSNYEIFDIFTDEDIDECFNSMVSCGYGVPLRFEGTDIIIKAYRAGRLIGSSIWEIRKEYDKIYYAMEFNPRHNNLVDGADIKSIKNPTLFITDSYNWSKFDGSPENRDKKPTKQSDLVKDLGDTIWDVLKIGGNVLIPSDNVGKCLDILIELEKMWREKAWGLSYDLYFLQSYSKSTINRCVEFPHWLRKGNESNLEFNYLQLIENMDELRVENKVDNRILSLNTERVRSNGQMTNTIKDFIKPMVVVTPMTSLNTSFAQYRLVNWGSIRSDDNKNLLLMTEKPPDYTLSYEILKCKMNDYINDNININNNNNNSINKFHYIHRQKVVLRDDELEEYKKKIEEENELKRKNKLLTNQIEEIGNESSSDEDEEEEDDDDNEELDNENNNNEKERKRRRRKKNIISELAHGKYTIPKYKMFGYNEENIIIDDYGMKYNNIIVEPPVFKSVNQENNGNSNNSNNFNNLSSNIDALSNPTSNTSQTSNKNVKIDPLQFEKMPMKTFQEERTMEVNCKVKYIPFNDHCEPNDSYSIITGSIQPKKLIIVHGNKVGTENMANNIVNTLTNKNPNFEVYIPRDTEIVELKTQSTIIKTKIDKQLISKPLKFMKSSKDCSLGFISCEFVNENNNNNNESKDNNNNNSIGYNIDEYRNENENLTMIPTPQFNERSDCDLYVSEEELVLYKLNKLLIDNKIKTDIERNKTDNTEILCNNLIKIKIMGGNLFLDGPVCKLYYAIKDILFSQLRPLF